MTTPVTVRAFGSLQIGDLFVKANEDESEFPLRRALYLRLFDSGNSNAIDLSTFMLTSLETTQKVMKFDGNFPQAVDVSEIRAFLLSPVGSDD